MSTSDGLKGRVIELSLADLDKNETNSFRKIKLCIEDVQGYKCLLNFHAMDMTHNKLFSLIKKKQSIIEASVNVRTTDGYIVRQENQDKVTCYAQATMTLVKELIKGTTGENIENKAHLIFPIKECYIRKVKVLKKHKFDVTALMEWQRRQQ